MFMEKNKETEEFTYFSFMMKAVMVEMIVIWILSTLYLIKISL